MEYFQAKNPTLGKFLRATIGKVWYILFLWQFGNLCSGKNGIYFPFWYIVPRKIWQPCWRHLHLFGLRSTYLHTRPQCVAKHWHWFSSFYRNRIHRTWLTWLFYCVALTKKSVDQVVLRFENNLGNIHGWLLIIIFSTGHLGKSKSL
jgi:hypothetical protein